MPSSAAAGPPKLRAFTPGCETFVIDLVTTVRVDFVAAFAVVNPPAESATVVSTTVAIVHFDIDCPFVP